jgi:hypothetical protein
VLKSTNANNTKSLGLYKVQDGDFRGAIKPKWKADHPKATRGVYVGLIKGGEPREESGILDRDDGVRKSGKTNLTAVRMSAQRDIK